MSGTNLYEFGTIGYDGAEFVRAHRDGQPSTDVPVQPAPAPDNAPAAPASSATDPFLTAPSIPVPTPIRSPTSLPVPHVAGDPAFDAEDYGAAALALLPTGRAWPRDPGSVQAKVFTALGKSLADVDGRAGAFLRGSLPGEKTPLVPEWEATLGLPKLGLGLAVTLEQRLAQVRGRFTDGGGTSRARYVAFAAALGFSIELVIGPAADFSMGVHILSSDGVLPPATLMILLREIAPAEVTISLLP